MFSTEAELQEHCAKVLESKGLSASREVPCGNGYRADIVAGNTVYEVKLELSYENLYKAYGQAQMYSRLLRKKHIHLVGYAPRFPQEREKAQRLANQLRGTGAKVSFVESDPFWELSQSEYGAWKLYRRTIGLIFGVLILYYLWNIQKVFWDARDCTANITHYTCINPDGTSDVYRIWK